MTCKQCEKYRKELKKLDLAFFLHKHIEDTCLADTLLDFFVFIRNDNALEFLKDVMTRLEETTGLYREKFEKEDEGDT